MNFVNYCQMKNVKKRLHNTSATVKIKLVRVNAKTVIEVPADVPDQEARENYLLKIEENNRKFDGKKAWER